VNERSKNYLVPTVIEQTTGVSGPSDLYSRLLKERISSWGRRRRHRRQPDDQRPRSSTGQSENPDQDVSISSTPRAAKITGALRHLRHDAVNQVRRPHHLHRAGRSAAAVLWRPARNGKRCALRTPGSSSTSPHGGAAGQRSTSRSGQGDHQHADALEEILPSTTPARRWSGSTRTPTSDFICAPRRQESE